MLQAELLILDYVVETWLPLQWLSNDVVEEVLNKPFHNMSISDLIPLLEKLFQKDYIVVRRKDDRGYTYFTPSRRDIEEGLAISFFENSLFDYGLTLKGGTFWEEVTEPNWDRYVHTAYGIYNINGVNPYPQEGEIITTSKKFTQRYLEKVKWLQLPITGILPDTETWDVLHPWQATYWKELTTGHKVKFLYTDKPSPEARNSEEEQAYPLEHVAWYRSF